MKELTQNERVLAGFIEIGQLVPVESAADWKATRDELHNVAGWFIDTGQAIKAQIALMEVKRLDDQFREESPLSRPTP